MSGCVIWDDERGACVRHDGEACELKRAGPQARPWRAGAG